MKIYCWPVGDDGTLQELQAAHSLAGPTTTEAGLSIFARQLRRGCEPRTVEQTFATLLRNGYP